MITGRNLYLQWELDNYEEYVELTIMNDDQNILIRVCHLKAE